MTIPHPHLPSPEHSLFRNTRASSRNSAALPVLVTLCAVMFSGGCASRDSANRMVVSLPDQKMALFHHNDLRQIYPISTSKFGIGDAPGSYATPEGRMRVAKKIGAGAPGGAVFKSRRPTGEILKPNAPGRDPIVSRILWLEGLQANNRNAFQRFIYIHGTTEENKIGTPSSFGCIRMTSSDVMDLFDRIGVGAEVAVTRQPLRAVVAHSRSEKRAEKQRRNAPDAAPNWAESALGTNVASRPANGEADGTDRPADERAAVSVAQTPSPGDEPPREYADREFADGATVRTPGFLGL